MNLYEQIRTASVALLLIVAQLVLYTSLPQLRAGLDLYIALLLILAGSRGTVTALAYGIAGGLIMDSFSPGGWPLHLVYYCLPALLGLSPRTRLLLEYRQLAAAACGILLLLKIVIPLAVDYRSGPLAGFGPVFATNYLGLLLESVLLYFYWPLLQSAVLKPEGRARA